MNGIWTCLSLKDITVIAFHVKIVVTEQLNYCFFSELTKEHQRLFIPTFRLPLQSICWKVLAGEHDKQAPMGALCRRVIGQPSTTQNDPFSLRHATQKLSFFLV